MRLPLVPLVLTVISAGGVVVGATAASGAPSPVPVAMQSGHWVVNGVLSAALHVHGGTGEVDARVDLPPGAAGDGSVAVAGASEGFVVAGGRVWTFDRSTLTVASDDAAAEAPEAPVPIEVVGGPYLVYRQAGTIVRLGEPAVVVEAGGPLGPPVRTPDGSVVVHRPDTGEVCALRRDALELDCSISTRPGVVGGLSVVGSTSVFVDTAGDAAYRVLLGAGLDGGTPLGVDLPGGALLGDRAVGDRLPVVVPGENVLRLVDVDGLERLRPGGPPIDVPLGEGAFSAPVAGESAIALLELTTARLLTFGPDGVRLGETTLPPGSTADSLTRGEDGRLYLDEAGGGRTHVVQPDGSVTTVDIGDGTGPAVAAAPPPEQLAPVRPPPPGQVLLPAPGAPVVAVGPAPGDAVIAAPGLPGPGGIAVPGAEPPPGDLPPPPLVVPPAVVPPADVPPADVPPPVGLPEEPPVAEVPDALEPGEPGPPAGLTAQRRNVGGDLVIDVAWTPPTVGTAPVEYEVDVFSSVPTDSVRQAGTGYRDDANYCSQNGLRYEVYAIGPTGARSAPAIAETVDPDVDCTPDVELLSVEPRADGSVDVEVGCTTSLDVPYTSGGLVLLVDGVHERSTGCTVDGPGAEDRFTFSHDGLAPGSTHTVQVRTDRPGGRSKFTDTVTVTTVG